MPTYCLHKASGQAIVRVRGKDYYLGVHGSEKSLAEYRRVLAENGFFTTSPHAKAAPLPFPRQSDVTINELLLAFWEHVQRYYVNPDGSPGGEQTNFRAALRFLRELYGHTIATEFGPLALKAVRQRMIDAGHARTFINHNIARIRMFFKWAAAEEAIPASIYQALQTVAGLRHGRTSARESDPVRPVPLETVEATLKELSPQLVAMVRLQLLTGCRPGEVCRIRPCDITIATDGTWTYRPREHKTAYRGRERRIFLGPQAQAILRPWLDRATDAYCFSPAETRAEFDAERKRCRKSPMTPSQAARKPKGNPKWVPGDQFTHNSYCRAIARACYRVRLAELRAGGKTKAEAVATIKRDGVPGHWSPHQLRHTRATQIEARYGIEAAQVCLGHSEPNTTRIYSEGHFAKAAGVMREIG